MTSGALRVLLLLVAPGSVSVRSVQAGDVVVRLRGRVHKAERWVPGGQAAPLGGQQGPPPGCPLSPESPMAAAAPRDPAQVNHRPPYPVLPALPPYRS